MKSSKNRYTEALFKCIIFWASIHLLFLLAVSLIRQQYTLINVFKILNLDLIFPEVKTDGTNFIISWGVIAVSYLLIFIFFTKKRK